MTFGGRFFQTKLLSRLSYIKVCRLLPSSVLLRTSVHSAYAFGKVKIQFFYGLNDPFCVFFVVNSIINYKWWWYYPLRKCRRSHLGIRGFIHFNIYVVTVQLLFLNIRNGWFFVMTYLKHWTVWKKYFATKYDRIWAATNVASYRRWIFLVCVGNSMICSNIWHYNHEWYFKIEIWDNFEISRVIFMPNITYKSSYYLFILLPAKGLKFSQEGISN